MLAFSEVGQVHSGTDASSYATGAFLPTAGALLIAFVHSAFSGTPETPILSGHGTWTPLLSYQPDTAGTQAKLSAFALIVSGSPSSAAVTADFNGQTQQSCNMQVIQVTGAAAVVDDAVKQPKSGTVNSSGTGEASTLDASLGTAANAILAFFQHQANEAHSESDGTIIAQGGQAGPSSTTSAVYQLNDNSVAVTWTTSAGRGSIGLEIVAASEAAEYEFAGDVSIGLIPASVMARGAVFVGNTVIGLVPSSLLEGPSLFGYILAMILERRRNP